MNNVSKKLIVISIILLLIGVSVSSAISVDTKSTISNNQREECSECKEVSKSDLILVERLLDRVEVYSKLLLVLSRYNPELKEISEELVDEIPKLKNLNDDFPIICFLLLYLCMIAVIICEYLGHIANIFPENSTLYKMLYNLSMFFWNIALQLAKIYADLDCPWDPYP